jgi:hypothetical protein
VIYVDDNDLLHWPTYSATDPEELVEHVQRATTDYGCLAMASGGILKEKKCSVYFMDYKNINGRFRLKQLDELAAPRLYIMEEGQMIPSPSHIGMVQANVGHKVTITPNPALFIYPKNVGKTRLTDESRVKNHTKITMT